MFKPEIGDTIITNYDVYTCVPRAEVNSSARFDGFDFYGKSATGGFCHWTSNGDCYKQGSTCSYDQDTKDCFKVQTVVAKQSSNDNYEFRIRTLEKENAFLTSMLMNAGLL